MEHLIEELYAYFPWEKTPDNPEGQKAKAEYLKLCDFLVDQYGVEFVDRLNRLRGTVDGYDGLREFSHGFRLGVRLMLEVFI